MTRGQVRTLSWVFVAVGCVLLVLAATGVVASFYISPTRPALARAADGERTIRAAGFLLLPVAVALGTVRMTWSAVTAALSAALLLLVPAGSDQTAATYLVVPVCALLLGAGVTVDRHGQQTPQRFRR